MKPITYHPEVEIEEGEKLLFELLGNNMNCSAGDRLLILLWLSCFLFVDFTSTRPITRFEGPAGSGKTTAAKLLSTLLYGESQQKRSTDAANYADGARNPLVLLDNIESAQMSDGLISFLLTSATECVNMKRKLGTDSETIEERVRCLVTSTGIEPLAGRLSEIQTRTFIINFDESLQHQDACFIECDVISAIQSNRDLILSALFKRASRMLAMKREGMHSAAMRALQKAMPKHGKRRSDDFISLMFLSMLAAEKAQVTSEDIERHLPAFAKLVDTLNVTSFETSRESNQVAAALHLLFKARQLAEESDYRHRMSGDFKSDFLGDFYRRSQLTEFNEDGVLVDVKASDLFRAMQRIAKREHGLPFDYVSGHQFARRFSDDLETIRSAGFEIKIREDYKKRKLYTISLIKADCPALEE
jgi:DNA primase